MNEQEIKRIRDERRSIKQEFGPLFKEINEIIFRHDPMLISIGTNKDEYEPEVGTILPRLKDCNSPTDIQRVVHEEFVKWFEPASAGDPIDYKEIAFDIWEIWQNHLFS